MKKQLHKAYAILLAAFLATGLAACNEEARRAAARANGASEQTIAELGATIEAAGMFWQDWFERRGAFDADEHIDWSHNLRFWEEHIDFSYMSEDARHHPLANGFAVLLPSSGFASLGDIGAHLLQFYTQAWVNRGQFHESTVVAEVVAGNYADVFGWRNAFQEYGGDLFVLYSHEGTARPDWATATHTLIEQAGDRAEVETVVSTFVRGYSPAYEMPTITYRFTLINGRIDSGYGRWAWPEQPDTQQAPHAQDPRAPGFYVNLPYMQLFIYQAEHADDFFLLGRLNAIHTVAHPTLPGMAAERGEAMLIGATRTIRNVALVELSNDWDENTEEIIYIPTSYFGIVDALTPEEGIVITGFMGLGTMPWSGISFYDAQMERRFFAIHHDNSDSPYWYMMWDITRQIRGEGFFE